ncbi:MULTISPECIES: UDP-N-acetylmuramoyl-L-alanyl-D-glutamate--2,6-diaminopimelate ligase [Acidiphilium]|jgi:UDP-N-acetylmuramoyl-L-alanyl-D-glutamate--2,6-diaminopimelate ligase|uniref:UDP-N-acetylmuramoyl-L-alanyl-D-glutamate--2,6-diaminopimelate ligase n=3 Tax=Acidiphilium TaxID=522 RepID=A5FUK5_ACICJ|nr:MULTISPECIES: UDP-N-acetylmuramoyl-L-alanyl-D-glutamate--2,6-diaminopimelate ligase [Acidiphilium]MBU6356382.1 UDP-N-acetylmuramoyl-L-alanyl-D-glutamate--2,6-diaminopimelate ligase [Rhodospirillales bacterium]ABQ29287.1 UDP-N-acetylmuramoylalanyl-D-glutamate--2,6-diaminopimelate ligase [Acidiphilium cryptum JF-5]KDM68606.1 UDP-N-acetylmuramoyl-L-alanyl-D-glutamate--2,6-diaminopimelate ligase MurE [Acidiphilium sp. JA12-A1]MBS3024004.1 UDP-N-acetylmuramoyl-L-alanyl-D-glutamate--2,6-diaminopim
MDGLSRYGAPPGWILPPETVFSGITADSRAVRKGMIFAALPGARADGRDFIAQAVAQGAAAVLAPSGTRWPPGVPPRPLIEDPEPRRRLAEIAATLAGPLPETILGVTGTNGKTSTVDFIRQMAVASGRPAASLGTLGLIAPGFAPGASLTTPDPVTLSDILAALRAAGIGTVALEASSHGLDQFRLHGLRLAAGGFSNLTRDHLDYHGDMASYRRAKLRLFQDLLLPGAPAVAMADLEPDTLAALRDIAQARRLDLATVGAGGDLFDLRGIIATPSSQVLTIACGGVSREIELPLPGRFQVDNALLAAGLARAAGVSDPLDRLPGLAPVRGRLERAAVLPNGAAAYVDYAHTPDALERLLMALRPHAAGRLVLVFGAGGDRDRGKRKLMGDVAARLADVAIVTDDNPRSEDPASIRAAILAACPGAREIGDRRAAIAAGLDALRAGDVLAVAGKGHESGQIVGDAVLPFDDAAVIRELAA